MPVAEHPIDAALVQALLADQHPDLAGLPLAEVACGWDNVIYRLGSAWSVRLPRRALAVAFTRNEQRWLPRLAEALPLPVPAPARLGGPGRGYPWPWSVCPWFDGETAADAPLDLSRAARDLGAFVAALAQPAPPDAPTNPYRGGPLAERSPMLEERLSALGPDVDAAAVRKVWRDALDAPAFSDPPRWIHGDLHPANLVVRDGRLAAVLDFGDLAGGDPATDLAVAWMLFPAEAEPARTAFRRAAGGADGATWRRARGWALSHAIACLAGSADNPRMHRVGAATLEAVLADRPQRTS